MASDDFDVVFGYTLTIERKTSVDVDFVYAAKETSAEIVRF